MDTSAQTGGLATATSTALLDGLRRPDNRTIWQQFVDRYRPLICKYARRLGLGPEEAEEAAQETLLAFSSAYRAGRYDSAKGRLRDWLFGIARHQILTVARRRAECREVQVVDDPQRTAFFDLLQDEDRLQAIWDEEWRRAVYRQCLAETRVCFERSTMEAFELYVGQDRPAREVAAALGLTENAVFLAKHKVLKHIRALLAVVEETW